MMDLTAEQTARMAELFEKKNLTPQESAEYQALINVLPHSKEPAAFAPEKPKRESAHRYPWSLYLISVAIAIPSIAAVMVLSGVLYSSSYLSIPEIVTTILTMWAIAVVSIWAYRMPRRVYDRKHYQQEEAPLKRYPWYLYLVSIGIGVVAYYAIFFAAMSLTILTNNVRLSSGIGMYFQLIFPIATFAVVSVWAFLLPRKMYDKKHQQQEETPTSTN